EIYGAASVDREVNQGQWAAHLTHQRLTETILEFAIRREPDMSSRSASVSGTSDNATRMQPVAATTTHTSQPPGGDHCAKSTKSGVPYRPTADRCASSQNAGNCIAATARPTRNTSARVGPPARYITNPPSSGSNTATARTYRPCSSQPTGDRITA